MFQITAVPFDAFNDLPDDCRWIAVALARYADKAGRCWPTMRQIAALIRVSPATVCRRLKKLADLGVFHRKRQGVGRYVYTLAEAYRLRWKPKPEPRENPGVSRVKHGVSQGATARQVEPSKYEGHGNVDEARWPLRLRLWTRSRFWQPMWGPKPGEPGCFAPETLLAARQTDTDTDRGRNGR